MRNTRIRIALSVAAVSVLTVLLAIFMLRSFDAAVVAFALIAVLALLFLNPFVGFLMYVAFLYVRPMDMIPALSPQHIPLMMIVGVGTIGSLIVRNSLEGKSIRILHNPIDVFIWLFFLGVVLSDLIRLEPDRALNSGSEVARLVTVYFLSTNLTNSEPRLRKLGFVLLLCTLVLAAEGIVQHYTGVGMYGQSSYKYGRIGRLYTFANPNALGMALLMGLPFAYFSRFESKRRLLTVIAGAASIAILYGMYLTNSRGTMVGLAGVLSVLLVRKLGWVKGISLGAVLSAVIYFLGPSRMSTISVYEPSAYYRVLAWGNGYHLFASQPLFGVGYGEWGDYPMVAHNSFVHCMAQLGIFGLLAWVMLLFLSVKYTYFISKNATRISSPSLRSTSNKVLFSLVAYLLTMVFISKAYMELLFIILGFASAATNVFVQASGEKYVLFEKRDLLQGLLIMLVGVLFFRLFVLIVTGVS